MTDGAYYLDPELYDVVYGDIVADIEPYLALLRGAGFSRWEARPLLTDHAGPSPSSLDLDRPVREGDIVQWSAWKD